MEKNTNIDIELINTVLNKDTSEMINKIKLEDVELATALINRLTLSVKIMVMESTSKKEAMRIITKFKDHVDVYSAIDRLAELVNPEEYRKTTYSVSHYDKSVADCEYNIEIIGNITDKFDNIIREALV